MGGFIRDITGTKDAGRTALQAGANALKAISDADKDARRELTSRFPTSLNSLRMGRTEALRELAQGATDAQGDITGAEQAARGDLTGQFGRAEEGFAPFFDIGTQAAQREAALTGALGPEAQAQAIQGFQESPATAFLREQGEKAALRGAAAQGRALSGSVLAELQRRGTGLASQDFNTRVAQLASLAGRGQQAGAGLGAIRTGLGQELAQGRRGLGQQLADINLGTAQQRAGLRERGRLMEAQMRNTLGQQLANIAQSRGVNEAGLITGAGQQLSGAQLQGGSNLLGTIGTLGGLAAGGAFGGLGGLLGGAAGGAAAPVFSGGAGMGRFGTGSIGF